MQIRRTAAALTSAAALSVSGVAMATPAQAAPVFTGGLVNVAIDDIEILNNSLNNVRILNGNQVTVGVVAQVQALVCDTNVNLIGQLVDDGTAQCTADGQTIHFSVVRDLRGRVAVPVHQRWDRHRRASLSPSPARRPRR